MRQSYKSYIPNFDKKNSEIKSYSKNKTFSYENQYGTWTVYLSYDDHEQRNSQYDNLYRKTSMNCNKEYAIKNAKDWLLIEHPKARNIFVKDCYYEGYSTSPID